MSRGTKYSKEFKLGALQLLGEGKSLREVSENLGIRQQTLSNWKKQFKLYGNGAFVGVGNALPKNENQEEVRRLKKENASLKMERDILKKALSIFSKSDGSGMNL